MDAEIQKIKLSVTNRCMLNCSYCFVKKNSEVMLESVAKYAIKALVESPGVNKKVLIYGGEPLLEFELVKELILFARKEAKKNKKELTISIATNGILIDVEKLLFFKKNNIKISISIDGDKKTHVPNRLNSGQYSYREVLKNIKLSLLIMSPRNVSSLVAVTPGNAKKLYRNLLYLEKIGIENFNIEPIQGLNYEWLTKEKEAFEKELKNFIKHIFKLIRNDKFIFLGSITNFLIQNKLVENKCLFRENMDISPVGDISLSPFLLNEKRPAKFIVGNFPKGFKPKYKNCLYDKNSKRCRLCWKVYSENVVFFGSEIVQLRNYVAEIFSVILRDFSKKEKSFSNYIIEAKKRVFE